MRRRRGENSNPMLAHQKLLDWLYDLNTYCKIRVTGRNCLFNYKMQMYKGYIVAVDMSVRPVNFLAFSEDLKDGDFDPEDKDKVKYGGYVRGKIDNHCYVLPAKNVDDVILSAGTFFFPPDENYYYRTANIEIDKFVYEYICKNLLGVDCDDDNRAKLRNFFFDTFCYGMDIKNNTSKKSVRKLEFKDE